MTLRNFELLKDGKLSDREVSELVVAAEDDLLLKEAIDGFLTECILEDEIVITHQIELLSKPIEYHKNILAAKGEPRPWINVLPGGNGKYFAVSAIGLAATVILFFIIVPAFRDDNTSNLNAIKTDTITVKTESIATVDKPQDKENSNIPAEGVGKTTKEDKAKDVIHMEKLPPAVFGSMDSVKIDSHTQFFPFAPK